MSTAQQETVTPHAAVAPVQALAGPPARSRLSGVKVMLIDDSNTIRCCAKTLLEQAGCEVTFAVDGFDALQKIAACSPDIIFADILMPRLDGYQICALIKRSPLLKHIPVIMLTSKDGIFDRARGHAVGSSQFLTKPFSKESLLRSIEAQLAQKNNALAGLQN